MAARLGLSRADVTTATDRYELVTAVVQSNTLKITNRRTGEMILRLEDVVAVENVRRNREWTVRFGDGPAVTVERSKAGCGCS